MKRVLSQIVRNIAQQKSQIHQNSSNALKEAKSLVGYSFCFGQKWLESENIRIVDDILAKEMVGCDVDFVSNMKKMFRNNYQLPWGLVILLISKAADGQSTEFESDLEVLNIQRSVAEVGEMLRFMTILHNKVQNLPGNTGKNSLTILNNNVFLLIGDYLLARSYQEFAAWKRSDAMEVICSGIRDFTDAAFMAPTDSHNRFIPARPEALSEDIAMRVPDLSDSEAIVDLSNFLGNAKKEWIMRHLLGGAILLSKSCQAALIVADHPKLLQIYGHILGSNLALANQASVDYSKFLNDDGSSLDLVTAPLMFHLQDNPNYYQKILDITKARTVDYEEIRRDVRRGNGLNKTRKLVVELTNEALRVLEKFPDNKAKVALKNIINDNKLLCNITSKKLT